eukprot:TRINITY_DN38819_c0_g2_i1.p1 TRINITY_DN38819_c0_g2~~TRINITY_DN38819_c0_g2_i1.p1  ORF type:complete len:151 (+),score=23.55 TRINITY_DN38819_c0_g2_i1:63-455(+)
MQAFSFMELLSAGWIGPFEAVLHIVGGPLESPHGQELFWPVAQGASVLADAKPSSTSWCRRETALEYLLTAVNDTDWRQGYVWAAQQHLYQCELDVLVQPPFATPIWGLLALLGRLGVDASGPPPPYCPS